jgi:hypothetical protein
LRFALTILFILCAINPCQPQAASPATTIIVGTAGTSVCTAANPEGNCAGFNVCQNFEGVGVDNSETSIWAFEDGGDGEADPDYTSAPLRGSQSLLLDDATSSGTYGVVKWTNDTGVAAQYFHFRIKVLDYPDVGDEYHGYSREIFHTYHLEGTNPPSYIEDHELIYISTTGVLRVTFYGYYNENDAVGSTQLAIGTEYHVWLYINRSSTSSGSGWLKLSTSGTIPPGNEIEWSGKPISATYAYMTAAGFTTKHGENYSFIIDQVLFDESAIGSVCD